MSQEAASSLKEILYEQHQQSTGAFYEVFWYHWPSDGVFPWEDYEPIVFVYNIKHDLCFVFIRRGWRPIILDPDEVFQPVQIMFKLGNHHQFVRKVDDDADFDLRNLSTQVSIHVGEPRIRKITDSRESIPVLNISGPFRADNIYNRIEKAKRISCE